MKLPLTSIAALILTAALAAGPARAQQADPRQEAFQQLLDRVQKNPNAVTNEEVIQLLQAGKDLAHPHAASMAAKSFLATHLNVPPDLMRLAGECAQQAGDYRAAVTRYKQYLKVAPPGAASSDAAANLYRVLIDFLGAGDDAFTFMDEHGEKFRQSVAARRYDPWFLYVARDRRAYASMARRLVQVFSDKLPVEQERLYYWEYMDWLMSYITRAAPEQFDALPHCQRLIPLIRENPSLAARYSFYTANLAFKATAAGKDPAALEADYKAVVASARAYVDVAPTAATFQDIFRVFMGGRELSNGSDRFDGNDWNRQAPQKRDVLFYAMQKLDDANREKVMGWSWGDTQTRMLSPEQWGQIGALAPELFKRSAATPLLPFLTLTNSPDFHKKQAAYLQGVPSVYASANNALAASGDLNECMRHLVRQESWYMRNAADVYSTLVNNLWPAYASFPRDEANKLPPTYLEKVVLQFGTEFVAKTPLAILHPDAAREYMTMAWRHSGAEANDKTQVAAHLHALDWVPYSEEQRRSVFGNAYNEFKGWADETRRLLEDAKRGQGATQVARDEAAKARAETARLQDESTKARDAAKAALAETAAAVAAMKQAQADQTKAQADTQAALKAAQDAKDDALAAQHTAKLQELAKALADFAAKLPPLEKAQQDLTAKGAELDKALADLAARAQQQDAAAQDTGKKNDDAAAALKAVEARGAAIAPIEEAFRQVMDPKVTDPAKGPDALCQNMAKAVIAIQGKNLAAYTEAARGAYAAVRDYEAKRTPFGAAILDALLQNRLAVFDTIDFQRDVLADQLTLYVPGTPNRSPRQAMEVIVRDRPDWQWWQLPARDKEKIAKLNAVLAKGLMDLLAKNQFSGEVFDWLRNTRMGRDFKEAAWNNDVLTKMIELNVFQAANYKPWHSLPSLNYMYLIRNEFMPLNEKFPVERYFDDLFAGEIKQGRTIDTTFWSYSRDEQRKGLNAAAAVLQDFARCPFGYEYTGLAVAYDGTAPVYTRATFWDAQSRALGAEDAVRDAMLAKLAGYYGQTRFDEYAMGRFTFYGLDAAKPEGRKAFFTRLQQYLDRAAACPIRMNPATPPQLIGLGKPLDATPQELDQLVRLFTVTTPWHWASISGSDGLAVYLYEGLVAKQRNADLFALAPYFWRIARDTGNTTFQRQLVQYAAQRMEAGDFDLAATFGVVGLDLLAGSLTEDARNGLLAIRSKSLSSIGTVIPVERADRRYPIYASQAAYLAGKFDNAWEEFLRNRGLILSEYKDLDPAFSIWVLEKLTEVGNYNDADALAQKLITWVDSAPQGFDPEVRARLLASFADIPFARQEYPRARALYERVAVAKEFEGTQARKEAELKMAEVDRLTRHYDSAILQLEKLIRRNDAFLQTEGAYQLALIKFDQEEFPEARKYLDQVFALDLRHVNARILEGKLYLRMKKLVEATDVKVGLSSAQETIVPGRPLKVQLEDRNLAVVGKSSDIEVRVWTDSGDEEFFVLLPFGDSKTKFEGQIPTALAPQQKGDHTLQVLGADAVHYDFSDRFKKANKIAEAALTDIAVGSDAELFASSGKILTREEQEQRALERMIRERQHLEEAAASGVSLSTVREEDEVKPGAPISLRVADPDQSATAQKDKVRVRVSTTSGDRVDGFVLEETDTHSGVFEGKIPTASMPATAYASDSEEGKEPNFAISAGDYPAWVALPDGARPKIFNVDLNNNVALGRMTLVSDVAGRRLKSFILQSSVNGKEFDNVAAWPGALEPWNGLLRLVLVRYADMNRAPNTIAEFREYLNVGAAVKKADKVTLAPPPLDLTLDDKVRGFADKLGLTAGGANSWYIGHLSGHFAMTNRQVRTLRLDYKGRLQNIRYFLTVDGQQGKTPYEFSQSLSKGLHRLDVYMAAQRGANPSFRVMCDIPAPPYIAPCPAELFDADRNPELAMAAGFQPAEIKADEAGQTFEIAFAPDTRARALRLHLLDFETDAPAIRKISLQSADGQAILPTTADIVTLKKNQVLEIVPGDRIQIAYEDPHYISKNKQVLEASLTATYRNAQLSACFVESYIDDRGNRQPRYVPMRRFRPNDTVSVFISDPDGDVTDEPDKLKFAAQISGGQPVELEALESEPHSGIFIGRVFPVAAAPQRPSEITVGASDDLLLSYLDQENTDPGIPWNRVYAVEQTSDSVPELRIYDVLSRPLTEEEAKQVTLRDAAKRFEEFVPVTRSLIHTRPPEPVREEPASALLGTPLVVELTFPTIAQSPESKATIFVQTLSGAKKYGQPMEGAFDLNVPGTIRLERLPGDAGRIDPPSGYRDVLVRGNPYAASPLEDGRFVFVVPMRLEAVPDKTRAFEKDEQTDVKQVNYEDPNRALVELVVPYVDKEGQLRWSGYRMSLPYLAVRGDDEVFVGVRYTDAAGATNWVTQRAVLRSDVFFDVMDRRYLQPVQAAHVGETLHLRVIEGSRDLTDDKDTLDVVLAPSAGAARTVPLMETFGHSGIFKGSMQLAFAGDPAFTNNAAVLPVLYGDSVKLEYLSGAATQTLERLVQIYKGADGGVLPFTKRFKDPEIAVQTQFTVAEAYFELAKKHRTLGQEPLARKEIEQGKKLLEEAIRDYPRTEVRAQADYLLADLSLEFANDAVNEDVKKKHYMEAIIRFTDIVATKPDSPYAPKSQFKKALTYEKMGQIDQACEEYVKLSYRYPDNELVAETIARLGQYFLTKGKALQEKASAEVNIVEQEKIKIQARDMYKTAAQVFGRLSTRFPEHNLAGKTLVLSAQCYMRAEEMEKAIAVFKQVVDDKKADSDLIAQAMYWSADCYMKQRDYKNAYRMFKRVTWDYPESTWAKYARGRLTEPELAKVEQDDQM